MTFQVSTFVCNFVQENTYLVSTSTGKAALIDCGCAIEGEQEAIARRVHEWGLKVELLLFTHLHFDHVWGLPWAARTFPTARIYAHPVEVSSTPSPQQQMRAWGLEAYSFDFDMSRIRQLPTDCPLYLGETPIYDLFVPGHTAGHVAYYFPTESIVFTGDALFRGDIGRTDLVGGDYDTLIHSLQTQLMTLPEMVKVYPGHGPSSDIHYEKYNNPYIKQ